jgi:hypothetical protein
MTTNLAMNAVVDDSLSPDFPLGDRIRASSRRRQVNRC